MCVGRVVVGQGMKVGCGRFGMWGNGVGRDWFDTCRVNADVFPGSLNSNTDIVIASS